MYRLIQRQRRATLQVLQLETYRINPNTLELDEITADDATYKVGLFLDKDGTIPYGDDYIRTIHIQNAQSGKASYSNVLRGTYYVFELDENNKAIKLNDEVQIDKENSFPLQCYECSRQGRQQCCSG